MAFEDDSRHQAMGHHLHMNEHVGVPTHMCPIYINRHIHIHAWQTHMKNGSCGIGGEHKLMGEVPNGSDFLLLTRKTEMDLG